MTLDIHHKTAAWLRLITSLLFLASMTLVLALAGYFYTELHDVVWRDKGLEIDGMNLTAYVIPILFGLLIFCVVLGLVEVVASMLYLRGVESAKYWLLAFAALGIFNFPFGTALSIYTVWALTRGTAQLPNPQAGPPST